MGRGRINYLAGLDYGLGAPEETDDQRDDQKGQEKEEQDLRYTRRRPSNTAEAKNTSNKRDNQEDKCVVKHLTLLLEVVVLRTLSGVDRFLMRNKKGRDNARPFSCER
jgi:hypothetical protein